MAALVAVAAAAAAAVIVLPKGTHDHETFRPGAQVVRFSRPVRMTAPRRQAVNQLLDRFVPTAVERQSPLEALPLVTHAFSSGVSRAEWSRGNLPVFPYSARGAEFHGWTLDYSLPGEIGIELLLQPAPKESLGPIAYTAVLKKQHGRWLIDSFAPAASFAPQKKAARILAQPDFSPYVESRGSARLPTRWLLVPAGVLALILLVPLAFGVGHVRRSRRAWRAYRTG